MRLVTVHNPGHLRIQMMQEYFNWASYKSLYYRFAANRAGRSRHQDHDG